MRKKFSTKDFLKYNIGFFNETCLRSNAQIRVTPSRSFIVELEPVLPGRWRCITARKSIFAFCRHNSGKQRTNFCYVILYFQKSVCIWWCWSYVVWTVKIGPQLGNILDFRQEWVYLSCPLVLTLMKYEGSASRLSMSSFYFLQASKNLLIDWKALHCID